MFGGGGASTASYDTNKQARCLVALEGDTDRNRFVLGSVEYKDPNEVHVLDFNEDTNEVGCQRVFTHPNEIWHLATCPAPEHSELLFTTSVSNNEVTAKLWHMEGVADASAEASMGAPAPIDITWNRPSSEIFFSTPSFFSSAPFSGSASTGSHGMRITSAAGREAAIGAADGPSAARDGTRAATHGRTSSAIPGDICNYSDPA